MSALTIKSERINCQAQMEKRPCFKYLGQKENEELCQKCTDGWTCDEKALVKLYVAKQDRLLNPFLKNFVLWKMILTWFEIYFQFLLTWV